MKKAFLILIVGVSSILCSCKKDKDPNQLTSEDVKPDTVDSTLIADNGWPRETENNGTKLVYYQPQVDDWKDYKEITARLAFSLTPKDGKQVVDVASLKAETLVDKDNRSAFIKNLVVTDVRFPALDEKKVPEMEKLFKETLPKSGDPISVDRILADLSQTKSPSKGIAAKNDPPVIFYSTNPAVLVIVQGEPVLVPVEKTDIQYVVNTNWDLFFDKTTKDYYLLIDNIWLTSKQLDGKWTKTTKLPSGLSNLPSGQNFDDVIKVIPPPSSGAAPQVFYSNKPAELIAVNGNPKFIKIDGTKLMYIDNTENDVFASEGNGQYYVLLSGRWFKSAALTGPWTYAGNNLPADFAKIPKDSPRANVLSSVPGTQEAKDAVMLAQVPTTAIINKADAEAKAKVTYDGTPQFKPIEGTKMQYASNTQDKVIKVGDLYYLCFQAVWFMSTSPNGPWKTCDSVPKEIYTIPPSSPVYNTTYVTQTTTDTTVESSSTAGYFGAFIIGATVGVILTYGTGWYYPPYVYYGGLYPIYRPWPYAYGAGAVYNPWTGGYAVGRRVYGPYGAAGTSAWYNPATGRYGRSASVQGWYGGRTAASTYNPWTGNYARTNQGHNAYAQWGHSAATNGNQWAQTGHVTTRRGTAIGYETSGGNKGVITHRRGGGTTIHTNNNVYAGHDGHVYKKDANGNWSHYNNGNGGWTQAGTLGSSKKSGEAIQRNKPNQGLGANGAGERIQRDNLPKPEQNLGGETRHVLQPDITVIFSSNYATVESIFSIPMSSLDSYTGQSSIAYIYNTNLEYYLNPTGILGDAQWRTADKRRDLTRTVSGKQYFKKYAKPSPFLDYIPVIRYSEVLLNYAEAAAKTGNLTLATNLLNAVHQRSDATYTFPVSVTSDQTQLISAISKERRIELLGEGFRGPDLQRNLLPLPAKGDNKLQTPEVATSAANYIFPAPNTELATNKLY